MIKAPINPSDLSVIEGNHSVLPENSFIGSEGVGEVIKTSSGVTDIKVGDYVIPSSLNLGEYFLSYLMMLNLPVNRNMENPYCRRSYEICSYS